MVEDADGDGSLYGVDEPVLTAAERERERERDGWTSGRDGKSSTSGGGASDRVQKQQNPHLTNLSRMDGAVVAVVDESDGGGKPGLLDKQLLSGEAADTHTHTHTRGGDRTNQWKNGTEQNFSNGGCGCTEIRSVGTNRIPWREIPDVLAVEVQEEFEGMGCTSDDGGEPGGGHILRRYDPRVADYKDAEEVMEFWLNP